MPSCIAISWCHVGKAYEDSSLLGLVDGRSHQSGHYPASSRKFTDQFFWRLEWSNISEVPSLFRITRTMTSVSSLIFSGNILWRVAIVTSSNWDAFKLALNTVASCGVQSSLATYLDPSASWGFPCGAASTVSLGDPWRASQIWPQV